MNPIPATFMQALIVSGGISILTPSAISTSAEPDRDDRARLPCLATGTPAPATMKAAQVEMLNEPDASPPVPTTSIASAGASTVSILPRMVATAPVISSTVSPRMRRPIRKPPICAGVASPDIILSKACAASSRESCAPVATLPRSARNRSMSAALRRVPAGGEIEKILQNRPAVLGCDAFGMKLHAVHRMPLERYRHHQAVVGLGGDRQI